VAVTPSGGVQLYAVIAMKQRYANEARHVILSAMSSNVISPCEEGSNGAEGTLFTKITSLPGSTRNDKAHSTSAES